MFAHRKNRRSRWCVHKSLYLLWYTKVNKVTKVIKSYKCKNTFVYWSNTIVTKVFCSFKLGHSAMMTFCFIIPLNQNYKFIICRICDGRLKKVWPAFPLQQSNLLLPPILYFTIFVLLLLLIIYSTTVNSTFLLHLIYSIIVFIISIIYCILLQII